MYRYLGRYEVLFDYISKTAIPKKKKNYRKMLDMSLPKYIYIYSR